ncbi:hypothetical protein TrVE_jg5202 [Triparma verrucosa]|uniref:Uncharacterized protein n=1 Tax=Triparma verrucosa TaxID=1606542 RepID=A0A9W6ZC81_9STRA|nr:hypothetical protein TrVE_jg5202 [Triparma verrucosa]
MPPLPRIKGAGKSRKKITMSEDEQKKALMNKLSVDPLDVFMGLRDWSSVFPDAFLVRRSGTRVMSRCRRADKNEIEPLKTVSAITKRQKLTKKDIAQLLAVEEPGSSKRRKKNQKATNHFPLPITEKKRKKKRKIKKKKLAKKERERPESPDTRANVLPKIVAVACKPSPPQVQKRELSGTLSPLMLCPSPTPLSATLDGGAAKRLLDRLELNDSIRRKERRKKQNG